MLIVFLVKCGMNFGAIMSKIYVGKTLSYAEDSPLLKQCFKPQLKYVKYTDYGLRRFKKNKELRKRYC